MELQLTNEEKLTFFYNALCNGLSQIGGYGLVFDFNEDEYKSSAAKLDDSSKCFEDVLIQMLKDGHKLTMIDEEGDGDYTRSVSLNDVYERVGNTPMHHLVAMQTETDDGETADVILQTVFFNGIVFG